MGRRPTRLTDAQKAQVEALAAYLSQQQISEYFGFTKSTFERMMERDPEVAVLYKKGKAKAIAVVAKSLVSKAREGDTASQIFFLKTQGGWRETTRQEISGPDGAPIQQTTTLNNKSVRDLKESIASLDDEF